MTHKFIERVPEFDATCFEGSVYAAQSLIRWVKSIDPDAEATFVEGLRDASDVAATPNRVEIKTHGYITETKSVFPGWWVVNRGGYFEVLSQPDFWRRYERKS